MKVGAGSARLPVPLGTELGGYADRIGGVTGTLDELEVWCVRLGELTLVVADLVCANADLAAAVADAVGEPTWTMATHTHAGPDQNCGPGDRATPAHWLSAVPVAAAEAAERATSTNTILSWHTGPIRDVGAVRAQAGAEPSVPVDVLAARSADGRLLGALVVLPVHSTVLPASNTRVSADLAGAVRRALADRLDGAWVVVATGCAGDISTRATRKAQTPDECARLGEVAAAQIAEIIQRPPLETEADNPTLHACTRTLRLPVRPVETPELPPDDDRIAHTFRQGAAIAKERLARHPDGVAELAVSVARLGAIRLAGLGAEPYLSVRSELPAVVFGYTNGYAGYLPDEPAFTGLSYEVLSSPFRPDAAACAVRAITEMFDAEDDDD